MRRLLTTTALVLVMAVSGPIASFAQNDGGGASQNGGSNGNNGNNGNNGGGSNANAGGNNANAGGGGGNANQGGGNSTDPDGNRGHGNNAMGDDPQNPGAQNNRTPRNGQPGDSPTDGNSGRGDNKVAEVPQPGDEDDQDNAGPNNINFGTVISTLRSDQKFERLVSRIEDLTDGLTPEQIRQLIIVQPVTDEDFESFEGGSRQALENALRNRSEDIAEVLENLGLDDIDLDNVVGFEERDGKLVIFVSSMA